LSWLYKCYSAEFSQEAKVIKELTGGWGTCSRTVALDHKPLALACWRDTIAVGTKYILLLDAITGSQVAVLSGHTSRVRSLTFLPDGTSLVSGSDDKTLKLWDIQTGGVVVIAAFFFRPFQTNSPHSLHSTFLFPLTNHTRGLRSNNELVMIVSFNDPTTTIDTRQDYSMGSSLASI
jgi:WD40 repeat protein